MSEADELRARAFHEAGHVVVMWALGLADVKSVTIAEGDDHQGQVENDPRLAAFVEAVRDGGVHNLLRLVALGAAAGAAAEHEALGAFRLDTFGVLARLGPDPDPAGAFTYLATIPRVGPESVGPGSDAAGVLTFLATLPKADRESASMDVAGSAMEILKERWAAVEALASALVEQETLTGDEVRLLLSLAEEQRAVSDTGSDSRRAR